jgi:hypothetical protein
MKRAEQATRCSVGFLTDVAAIFDAGYWDFPIMEVGKNDAIDEIGATD